MRWFLLLTYLLYFLTHDVRTTSSCDLTYCWFSYNDKMYGLPNNTRTNYTTAHDCCPFLGPHLRMTILTSDDNVTEMMTYVEENFGDGAKKLWVDATRKGSGAPFTWPDGRLVDDSLWAQYEPQITDDCARLQNKELRGRECLFGNYTVFCQGYTPDSSDRVCELKFTWAMVSDRVYGYSSDPTDLETARQCCTAYGPYFRLAVFDDVTTADVITVELRGLVGTSSSFWVDAIRAGYNTSKNFTWSSGQPVSESQWAAVNQGDNPDIQDVVCHLEMNYTAPRLMGGIHPSTNHSVLCQEFDPPDQTQLFTESTIFTVSEPATLESLPASSIESLVATTSTNPNDVLSSSATIKSTTSFELVFEVSQTDSPLTSLLMLDPTLTISPSGDSTSILSYIEDGSGDGPYEFTGGLFSDGSEYTAMDTSGDSLTVADYPTAQPTSTLATPEYQSTVLTSGAESMALEETTLIPQTSIFSYNDVNTGDVSASTHTLTTLEQSTHIAPSFDSISSSEITSVFRDMSTPSFEPSETETYSTTASSTNENITSRIIHTCCCTLPASQIVTQTEPDVQDKIHSIQENLAVNKSILSKTIRRKTSATDDRRTARAIGGVGLACLLLSIVLVIIMDMRGPVSSTRPGIRIRRL